MQMITKMFSAQLCNQSVSVVSGVGLLILCCNNGLLNLFATMVLRLNYGFNVLSVFCYVISLLLVTLVMPYASRVHDVGFAVVFR